MATIQSQDGQARWEKPLSSIDTVLPAAVDFISGDFPPVQAFPMKSEGQTLITVGMVLGQDGANGVFPAAQGDVCCGIAMTGDPSGDQVNKSILVARTGCFDPDLLTWDSSFTTDAQKLAAFESSPSPTQIVLRKRIASAP